ncbi:MAG: glycosyltransferase family 9 protein [Steroidobacter sp.]
MNNVPPRSVCILRLSALGDVCHVLAVVRTLQHAWPDTTFTWIIGKLEARLLGHISDIEFIVFDKKSGSAAYRQLKQQLRGRSFDVLMHMQLAFRASRIAMLVPAKIKLGFDRARAGELQWLFTNRKIAPQKNQHVLDGLFGFAEYFGVHERLLQWHVPLTVEAQQYAERVIPDAHPTLIISPCSSHVLRNWRAEYYAEVADYAIERFGMRVLLCGGRSDIEMQMGRDIVARMRHVCDNLIGKDTLLQLLATLKRATVLLSPDSGPAHMATMVGTPVIGLYAATRVTRCGPYLSRQWCIDRFDTAAQMLLHKPASQVPWTRKIEREGVMDLITPRDVIRKLHGVMAQFEKRKQV